MIPAAPLRSIPRRAPFPGTPPTRATCAALAALYAAVFVYGSLAPFRFAPLTLDRLRDVCYALAGQRIAVRSVADLVTNVVALVPAGFLMAGALCLDAGPLAIAAAAPLILILGLALSGAAEVSQALTLDRIPSLTDVAAQSVGNAIGIVLWAAAGQRVAAGVRDMRSRDDHLLVAVRVLGLYAIGLAIFHLLPLDFTIHPSDLLHKYREGRILLVPDVRRLASTSRLLDVLDFVPIGLLAVLLATHWHATRRAISAVLLGSVFAVALEAVSIFIQSRSTSTLHIVTGILGVAIGVVVAASILASGKRLRVTR